MPKINGFQLYDMIKTRINPSKIKVCFFTAYTSYLAEYNQRFPKWNGCYCMTKPMPVKELAERLRELLDSK
jgi:DNA-binding response OmpR family regulator